MLSKLSWGNPEPLSLTYQDHSDYKTMPLHGNETG